MHVKGVLCVFIGHRWVQPPEFHEAYPVFECQRCRRQQEFVPGTMHAGFDTRLSTKTLEARSRIGDGQH